MTNSASRRRYGSGEQVNEVQDGITVGRREEMELQDGTGGTRDRNKPGGTRENPIGRDPNKPEEVKAWNESRRCFRCNHSDTSESARHKNASDLKWHATRVRETLGGGARWQRPPRGYTQRSGGDGGGSGGAVGRGGRVVALVDRRQ
jgi:hypothetical protein